MSLVSPRDEFFEHHETVSAPYPLAVVTNSLAGTSCVTILFDSVDRTPPRPADSLRLIEKGRQGPPSSKSRLLPDRRAIRARAIDKKTFESGTCVDRIGHTS